MPPHLIKDYLPFFLMTSPLDSHGTTDIKPEMLSGIQTGNGTPHDKYNIRGIAHVRKNRKDDIFMQRRLLQSFTYILEWRPGTCTLTRHTRRWTYSALRHFFLSEAAPRCGIFRYMCYLCMLCQKCTCGTLQMVVIPPSPQKKKRCVLV